MNTPQALPLTAAEVALVFGPALVGYALVALIAVSAVRAPGLPRPWARPLAWATLAILSAHVALLWSLRFGFDPAIATRNGWLGFASFHLAFVGLWTALTGDWLGRPWRRRLLIGVWLLVTPGAVGAPLRYPIVEAFAAPVIAVAALGAAGLVLAWRGRVALARTEDARMEQGRKM